jgi:hypothetical protein
MVATPIWIAGYGHQPTGSTASPVRIASFGKALPAATEVWIVGYGGSRPAPPALGATIVWIVGSGVSSVGATPVWIAGVGGAVRG